MQWKGSLCFGVGHYHNIYCFTDVVGSRSVSYAILHESRNKFVWLFICSLSDFDDSIFLDRQEKSLFSSVPARTNMDVVCCFFKVLDITRQMVTHARSHVDDVEFSAEDALRSDYDFLSEVWFSVKIGGVGRG